MITLHDKYLPREGRIFLSGNQALVRIPLMQRWYDSSLGLKTGGFVSGYRGSPLGKYDHELWQAKEYLEKEKIYFNPGVNEELAATSVLGSQQIQINAATGSTFDGVFGIWYGKMPGVDRASDALKHGNMAGTSPLGGVLLLAGDDHSAKSSSVASQSEHALVGMMIPTLHPANVQEMLDFGLLGIAMSRYSGCWVALKCMTEVVESSTSVDVSPNRLKIVDPGDFVIPDTGVHIRWPDPFAGQEDRLVNIKLPAVGAFARANGLDRETLSPGKKRLGIVSTGKAWLDVVQALELLSLTPDEAAEWGIGIYKVGMPWPLEAVNIREWAQGFQMLLVVEEKRGLIEEQLAHILYGLDENQRPVLQGKLDRAGNHLLPSSGAIGSSQVAQAIAACILNIADYPKVVEALAELNAAEQGRRKAPGTPFRFPWFCAGCPHNCSTTVPPGSKAFGGIGCHGMATFMPHKNTEFFCQMGGEGANWIGQQPFLPDQHVFQNLGDGTYFHSGILAIRAACAANINITYRILYNDAVAMTGGQPVEGRLMPWDISQQVLLEGVTKVVVVTDNPRKYPSSVAWGPGVTIRHRDEYQKIMLELRGTSGVTVILYDQVCATEKRRRIKQGLLPASARHVFINPDICDGCGDCGLVSNCVAIRPLETEFGRKRIIDQSICNHDFSCINGFCPSFVTVKGGRFKKPHPVTAKGAIHSDTLPDPIELMVSKPYNILVAGIGGTGVVTIGALLGMAAHIENKGVSTLDISGLAQKNGAVTSHIRIAPVPEDIAGTTVPPGEADLILGCDLVVAAEASTRAMIGSGRTRVVLNTEIVSLASFAVTPDLAMDGERLCDLLSTCVGEDRIRFLNASSLAKTLLGDSIGTNLLLVGFALQKGMLPLKPESIISAIELNGVAVEFNKQALNWGRRAALNLKDVVDIAQQNTWEPSSAIPDRAATVGEIIKHHAALLVDYQNSAYSLRYIDFMDKICEIEQAKNTGRTEFSKAVARNLYKLMAYKDEYEVARLFTRTDFLETLKTRFTDDAQFEFNLAPHLLSRIDPETGFRRKRTYGSWMIPMLKALASIRGLRGSSFDVFGKTAERRRERKLIEHYKNTIWNLLQLLSAFNYEAVLTVASLPEGIRGFGHVKEKAVKAYFAEERQLLAKINANDITSSRL